MNEAEYDAMPKHFLEGDGPWEITEDMCNKNGECIILNLPKGSRVMTAEERQGKEHTA